jgi:hypothetical protein
VAGVTKKVNGWLKARHMKELFTVTVTERDSLPWVTYRFNHRAWARLQKTLLGKTLLFALKKQIPIYCIYNKLFYAVCASGKG